VYGNSALGNDYRKDDQAVPKRDGAVESLGMKEGGYKFAGGLPVYRE